LSNLNRDFIYKLVTNFVRLPVSFAIQAISVRLLGPSGYGNFEFLTSFSTKIVTFFETGTSTAFYIKHSKEKTDFRLLKFYWYLVLAISIAYLFGFLILWLLKLDDLVWVGQTSYLIFLSIFWGVFTFVGKVVLKVVDAQGLTSKGEIARVIHQILSFIFIGALFLFKKRIELEFFFYVQLIIALLPAFLLWRVLHKQNISLFPSRELSQEYKRNVLNWFWSYSNPLLVYSLMGLIVGLGDRWLLQSFAGAEQQGYFGISFKVGAFIFLFTSAVIPLLIREFSKSLVKKDMQRIRILFVKNSKLLYFLASLLAVYVFFNADLVTSLFGGEEFKEAGFVVSLMAFYPVHQTYGQLNGSLYFSSERTKEYRNVGLVLMPLGLICSFFLLAPVTYWGLNLGAEGLAYQMLGIQVLTVNILLYKNCKYLEINFKNFVTHQLGVLGLLLFFGFIASNIFYYSINIITKSLVELIVYGALAIFTVYFYPKIIGYERAEIRKFWTAFRNSNK